MVARPKHRIQSWCGCKFGAGSLDTFTEEG